MKIHVFGNFPETTSWATHSRLAAHAC